MNNPFRQPLHDSSQFPVLSELTPEAEASLSTPSTDGEGAPAYHDTAASVASYKSYTIFNNTSRINFRIHAGDSGSPCLYYINNSSFTRNTPDVQLRLGATKESPIVASAKFYNVSRKIVLGLGDPGVEPGAQVVYEDLVKTHRSSHAEYSFETSEYAGEGRQKFVWKRKYQVNLRANYTCTVDTGDFVAEFVNSGIGVKRWKCCGHMSIRADLGERLEWLVLVSWAAMREKEHRD